MRTNNNVLDTSMTIIDGILIISLNSDIEDDSLENMSNLVTQKASQKHVDAIILNFSMVRVISTYTYTMFKRLSMAVELMGIKVVWVGLSPGVVISLIDLGLIKDMKDIKTSLNIEEGLKLICGGKR